MEAVIADSGPLVAYIRRDDQDHDWAVQTFQQLAAPLHTCDAVLSEVFYLLQHTHGGVEKALQLLERGIVVPDFDLLPELPAIGQLMRRYQNVPMSLADACLVRMVELGPESSILTLDSDFRIYRKHRRQAIALIHPDF